MEQSGDMKLAIFDTVYALGKTRSAVPFSAIPQPLMEDFTHFMTGRAFMKKNGEFLAYPVDFREWLQKLSRVGVERFDRAAPGS